MSNGIEASEIKTASPTDKKSQLATINNAIYAVLVGSQSYQIGSRKLVRADLAQLYKMRQELEADINAEENKSCLFDDTYVAVFEGR